MPGDIYYDKDWIIERIRVLDANQVRDAKVLNKNLDKLQMVLESADENGLFKSDSETYKNILSDLIVARDELKQNPPRIIEAWEKFYSAYHKFNQVVNSADFWWRFEYSFGGLPLIYLTTVFASIVLVCVLITPTVLDSRVLLIPGWAYLWGSIGGVLQGFWRLWQHVSDRILRKHWITWYMLLPIIGAILGALTYLIFFAGFITATGETEIKSEFIIMLLCAIAGFSSKWAVQLLDKLTTILQVRQ